jgi:hypothetical protein
MTGFTLQIDGEYYRLDPITDMLYITAFSTVQFVLMCWRDICNIKGLIDNKIHAATCDFNLAVDQTGGGLTRNVKISVSNLSNLNGPSSSASVLISN